MEEENTETVLEKITDLVLSEDSKSTSQESTQRSQESTLLAESAPDSQEKAHQDGQTQESPEELCESVSLEPASEATANLEEHDHPVCHPSVSFLTFKSFNYTKNFGFEMYNNTITNFLYDYSISQYRFKA